MQSIMAKTRKNAFWLLDSLKGSHVKNAYKQLKLVDELDSDSRTLKIHQQSQIIELLGHAISTTEFYRNIRSTELNAFPVINKNIIRDNQEDFLSNRFSKSDLITMETSGSTGTPFTCFQDLGKKRRVNAEVIYFSEKAGYSVGNNLIFLRAITKESQKSKIRQWIQNESLVDISNLDDSRILGVLEEISKVSRFGSVMLAYASTYDALKDLFLRHGFEMAKECKIKGIISSSEMFFDETRLAISEAFNCPCFSRYSNQENGVLGQDKEENNVFLLNEAHYFVEILKLDDDELAKEDEVGRIVITDLYNKAMPMIRYDTGDIGAVKYVNSGKSLKKAITNFGGRKVDVVYDASGNRLSPHIITNNFWSFQEIKQYQFIQEDTRKYTIKINVDSSFSKGKELKAVLGRLLGPEAEIEIEVVNGIPILESGKRKYIVNNMADHNW